MADRWPDIAIKSRSPSETQSDTAFTNEHDTVCGIAIAGVSAEEIARQRRLHDDAETVVGIE